MPVTVDIRFADDAGTLHEFAIVPNDSFDTINHFGYVEYRIDRSSASHVELPDLIDMNGKRLWHFEWLKAGAPVACLFNERWSFNRYQGQSLFCEQQIKPIAPLDHEPFSRDGACILLA